MAPPATACRPPGRCGADVESHPRGEAMRSRLAAAAAPRAALGGSSSSATRARSVAPLCGLPGRVAGPGVRVMCRGGVRWLGMGRAGGAITLEVKRRVVVRFPHPRRSPPLGMAPALLRSPGCVLPVCGGARLRWKALVRGVGPRPRPEFGRPDRGRGRLFLRCRRCRWIWWPRVSHCARAVELPRWSKWCAWWRPAARAVAAAALAARAWS